MYGQLYNNVMWAPLVEKAWAKVVGSYEQFVSDDTLLQQALRTLSGAPTFTYDTTNLSTVAHRNDLWNTIVAANSLGYLITAQVGGATSSV